MASGQPTNLDSNLLFIDQELNIRETSSPVTPPEHFFRELPLQPEQILYEQQSGRQETTRMNTRPTTYSGCTNPIRSVDVNRPLNQNGRNRDSLTLPSGSTIAQSDKDLDVWKQVAMALSRRTTPLINVEKPVFRDNDTLLPPLFLKQLEKYFVVYHANEVEKLEVAKSCLDVGTQSWVQVYEDSWTTYGEFRSAFVNRYWSPEKQHLARLKLGSMKYHAIRGSTMTEYFRKQVANYRIFDPPIPEAIIINEIMRQFPSGTQSTWAAVSSITIDSAFEFLERTQNISQSELRGDRYGSQNAVRYHSQADSQPQKHMTVLYNPKIPPPQVKVYNNNPYKYMRNQNEKCPENSQVRK